MRGELAPGERLPEDELATWLGVSRADRFVADAATRAAATAQDDAAGVDAEGAA